MPQSEVVRVHASSGTTGKSTVVGYTKNDLEMWTDVMSRLVIAAGVTKEELSQHLIEINLYMISLKDSEPRFGK